MIKYEINYNVIKDCEIVNNGRITISAKSVENAQIKAYKHLDKKYKNIGVVKIQSIQ